MKVHVALAIVATVLTVMLGVMLGYIGMDKNKDEDPVVVTTPTPTQDASARARALPDIPVADRPGFKPIPANLNTEAWLQFTQVLPDTLDNSALSMTYIGNQPDLRYIFSRRTYAATYPKVNVGDNNWATMNGAAWNINSKLVSGNGINSGYGFAVDNDKIITTPGEGTYILAFQGRGIGYTNPYREDTIGNNLGFYIGTRGLRQAIFRKANNWKMDVDDEVLTTFDPPLDPNASYLSFIAVTWTAVYASEYKTARFITKASSASPYVVQEFQPGLIRYSAKNRIGLMVGFYNLDQGSCTFAGSDIYNGQLLSDDEILQACYSYAQYWEPSNNPEIYSAPSIERFWVGESAQARNYAAPVSKTVGTASDNKYKFDVPLPTNLGLTLNEQTGQIEGTAKATLTQTYNLVLENSVLGVVSNPYPILIQINPTPSIEYTQTKYTFYTGVGGTVPAPTLNGFSAVTTSNSFTGMTFNADGSITVANTIGAPVSNAYTISGTPLTGINAKQVIITVEVTNKPDNIVTIDLQYPTITKFTYNQITKDIVPNVIVSGLPSTLTPAQTITVVPELPAAFELNATTGVITRNTAVPIVPQQSTRYEFTIVISQSDQGQSYYGTDSSFWDLEIDGVVEAPVLATLNIGEFVDYSLTYKPDSLNNGTTVYTIIDPSLPVGLVLSGKRITGKPALQSARQIYQVTSVIDDGVNNTIQALGSFSLEVDAAAPEPTPIVNEDYSWYYFAGGCGLIFLVLVATTVILAQRIETGNTGK